MKKNIIIVVLLILIPVVYFQHDTIERLIGPTETIQSESVDAKDLVERDGIHYKKFTEVPFTGKTTGKIQGAFKNGKKHGSWVVYHKNGQLESKGTYKNGKEHGPWVIYWSNGQLFKKGTLEDGKKDGPWVGYNKDGTVSEYFTGTYKNGVKVK
jgi:antitoxin component YwqK of YwqJK toxin-antitoxin module